MPARVVQVLDGIDGEQGDVAVRAEIGTAPAQGVAARDALPVDQHGHDESSQDSQPCAAQGAFPACDREGIMTHDEPAEQAGVCRGACGKPQEDGRDRIALPYHEGRLQRFPEEFHDTHVDALAQVEEKPEINDVDQHDQQRHGACHTAKRRAHKGSSLAAGRSFKKGEEQAKGHGQ